MQIEKKSQNKNLKIAIFEFLLNLYEDGEGKTDKSITENVHRLVIEYSSPDQLTDLR